MKSKTLSIGIIGAGGMGGAHALNLHSHVVGANLAAVCDTDMNRLHVLSSQVGSFQTMLDPYELMDNDSVEAIIIASPDATHAQYVLHALSLGKPVFCEKPLASDVPEALSLVQKEVEIGKKLISVGFNRRFDPHHQDLKKRLDSGDFGQPLLWKGFHRNASAMYNTAGPFILNNSAGHDVDSAQWMLNASVSEIYTCGIKSRKNLPDDACDLLLVNMRMSDGRLAMAEVYVNAGYGYEVGLEVVCQEGSVSMLPTEQVYARKSGNKGVSVSDDFRGYFARSYQLEMQSWVNSLLYDTPFEGADAWDGYRAIVVTQAAGRSLLEGVPLPVSCMERPRLYQREV